MNIFRRESIATPEGPDLTPAKSQYQQTDATEVSAAQEGRMTNGNSTISSAC
jgi:hypothetical protein